MVKRILKLAAILGVAGVILASSALVYLVAKRDQSVTLPAPGGPYSVGRMITIWTDASRPETLGGAPGQFRKLSVWIWYPAEPGGARLPYMPADWVHAREADRGIGSLFFQSLDSIHSHATDAQPSSAGGPFPLLIMEPGLGPVIPEYTTLAEDLASRGYVVIGLNPTYSAAFTMLDGKVVPDSAPGSIPDNATPDQSRQIGDKLVEIWGADNGFALGQAIRMNGDPASPFDGRLDVQHVGFLGHSFGGAAAFEFCARDSRCAAAADLDGWLFGNVVHTGLDRPAMLVSSDPGRNADTLAEESANRTFDQVLTSAPLGYHITIPGTGHFNFTDYAAGFNPLMQLAGVLGRIDGARGLHITSAYLAAFFDETLKGHSSSLLRELSAEYPEVQLTVYPAK